MRLVLWAFILWQFYWLNLFMPGHVRGAIRYAGPDNGCDTLTRQTDSCCAAKDPSTGGQPTDQQKRRCAVCYIAVGYSVAAAFVFEIKLTGSSHERFVEYFAQITQTEFAFPYYPSGPPGA